MSYKDPRQKQEWERLNRPARLARRREFRRIAAEREAMKGAPTQPWFGGSFAWPVLAGGVALTLYSPPLGLGAGAVTLIAAAVTKKSWHWWVVGVAILVLALILLQGKEAGRDTDISADI
jgi:hypothetical protein